MLKKGIQQCGISHIRQRGVLDKWSLYVGIFHSKPNSGRASLECYFLIRPDFASLEFWSIFCFRKTLPSRKSSRQDASQGSGG